MSKKPKQKDDTQVEREVPKVPGGKQEFSNKPAIKDTEIKANKKVPQVFLMGNGFPAPITEAFDLLSPHPIDGVRIPLQELFQTVNRYIGAPMTKFHVEQELRSGYSTHASQALILAIAIAVAHDQEKLMKLFSSPTFLKAVKEWLGLDKLEIDIQMEDRNIILLNGGIKEIMYTIPTENVNLQDNDITELTKELSSRVSEMNEVLEKQEKGWVAFAAKCVDELKEEFRAAPELDSLDQTINTFLQQPHIASNPDLKESRTILEKLPDKLVQQAAEEMQKQRDKEEKLSGVLAKEGLKFTSEQMAARQLTTREFKGEILREKLNMTGKEVKKSLDDVKDRSPNEITEIISKYDELNVVDKEFSGGANSLLKRLKSKSNDKITDRMSKQDTEAGEITKKNQSEIDKLKSGIEETKQKLDNAIEKASVPSRGSEPA